MSSFGSNSNSNSNSGTNNARGHMPSTDRLHHLQELRLRIWLPDDQVGKVIGKKGTVIKTINSETSTILTMLPRIPATVPTGENKTPAETEIAELLRDAGVQAAEELWSPAVLSGRPTDVLKAFMLIRALAGEEVDEVVAEFHVHRALHQLLLWGPQKVGGGPGGGRGAGRPTPTPWVLRKLSADFGVRIHVPDGVREQSQFVTMEGNYSAVFGALDTAMGVVHEKLHLFTLAEMNAANQVAGGSGSGSAEWLRSLEPEKSLPQQQQQKPTAILTKPTEANKATPNAGSQSNAAAASGSLAGPAGKAGSSGSTNTRAVSAPAAVPATAPHNEIKLGLTMAQSPVLYSMLSHRIIPQGHEYFLKLPTGSARYNGTGPMYRSAEVVVDLPTSIIGLLLVRRTPPATPGAPVIPPANVISQIQIATQTMIFKVLPPKTAPEQATAAPNAATAAVEAVEEEDVSDDDEDQAAGATAGGSKRGRDAKRAAKQAAKDAANNRVQLGEDKFGGRGNMMAALMVDDDEEDDESGEGDSDEDSDTDNSYCTGESRDSDSDSESYDSEGFADAVEGDLGAVGAGKGAAAVTASKSLDAAAPRPIPADLAAILDSAGLGSVSVCTVGADGKVEGDVIKFRVRGRLLEHVEKAVALLRDIVGGVSIKEVLAQIAEAVMQNHVPGTFKSGRAQTKESRKGKGKGADAAAIKASKAERKLSRKAAKGASKAERKAAASGAGGEAGSTGVKPEGVKRPRGGRKRGGGRGGATKGAPRPPEASA